MNKLLRLQFLWLLMFIGMIGANAETKTVTFSAATQNSGANTLVNNWSVADTDAGDVTFTISAGRARVSGPTAYVISSTGTTTFATTKGSITKVEFKDITAGTYGTSLADNFQSVTPTGGTVSGNVWTGSAESVAIMFAGTMTFASVEVTYEYTDGGGGGGGDETFVNSSDGGSDYQYNSFNFTVDPITFDCNNGSKYGTGLSVQNDAVFTISAAEDYTITKIEFTVSGASTQYGDDPNVNSWFAHCATASTGTFAENLWTGSASSVTFTTKTDWWYWIELSNVKVYYTTGGGTTATTTIADIMEKFTSGELVEWTITEDPDYQVQFVKLNNAGTKAYLWDGARGILIDEVPAGTFDGFATGDIITGGTIQLYFSTYDYYAPAVRNTPALTKGGNAEVVPLSITDLSTFAATDRYTFVSVPGTMIKADWGDYYYINSNDYQVDNGDYTFGITENVDETANVGKTGTFTVVRSNQYSLFPVTADYFVADAAPAVQSTVNIHYSDPHTGDYQQYSTTKASIQVDGQGYWSYNASYPDYGYIGMTNGQTTKFTALDDAKILKIRFIESNGWNSGTFQAKLTPSVGSFTSDDTWEGEATEVTFTHGAAMYFTEAEVTYEGGQVYVTAPTFDPASGSVTKGTAVSITQPAAASIIYTLDGTDPTYEPLNGTVYSEAITINAKTTIKAIAVDANGNTSDVVTGEYKIFVAQPTFSPTDVDVADGTAVTITQADAAYIVYTTNGTVPTYSPLNGTVYTEPVVINANTQFRAIAVDADGNESDAAYKTYNVIKEYSSLGDVLTNAANNELVNLTLPTGTVLIAKYSNYAFIYNNNEERGALVFNYNSNSKWPSTFGTTLTGTLRSKWIKTYWDFEETTIYPTAGEVTTVTPKVVTGAEAIASDNSNRYAYIQMDGTFDKDAQTFTAQDGTVFNLYPQTIFGIDWTVVESGDYTLRALMASNYGNSGIAANGKYMLGIVEPVEQSFVAIEETTYPTLAELKAAGSIGTLKIEAPYKVQVMYNVGPFGQTYLWDGETGFFMFGDGENALSATDKQVITGGKLTTYTDAYNNRSFKSEKDLVVENATEWIAPVVKETISNTSDAAKYMRLHGKVTSITNSYTGVKSYLLQMDNGNTRSINNKVGFTYDFEAIEGVDGTFDMLLTWENYAYELVPLDANFFVADPTFEPATVLFNETFAAFSGTGGRDNTLGGSVAGTKPAASDFDNDCTFDTNVYKGYESAKLGTSSKNGTITTPAIALTGEGTLSFNMAGWADTKTNSVTVTLTGATFYDASTTKTIDAVNGHWMTTYLDIIDGTGNVTIQFSGRRFFLDDIKVVTGLSELAEVNVGTTGYATLYYSDRNLVVPDGVEVTTHAVVDGSLQATNTLKYGDVIPAGTGVVLFDDFTSSALIYQFATYREAAEAPALANANNMLRGSDEAALTVGDNSTDKFYMLSRNAESGEPIGFYYAKNCPNGEAFTNGAHKAYLCVPAELANAYGYTFDGNTVDAIEGININTLNENDEVYTISGVRVQNVRNLQKGIYIVNGQRVAVK